jgi:hypothetical protein
MQSATLLARLIFAFFFGAILFTGCLNDSAGKSSGNGPAQYVAAVGLGNSSFVTPMPNLDAGSLTNTYGFEVGYFNYTFGRGNTVLVTENISSDVLRKFVRNTDGKLAQAGSLTLLNASMPADVAFASDTLAYVGLMNAGKIAVINPVTMHLHRYIDLTGNRYAVGDSNPDPGNLLIHRGKLWVTLMQQKNLYEAHRRVDIVVINPANDSVEHIISDTTSGLAQAGYPNRQNLFADELGDLYVYCIASAGYFPGQSHGFRRVKADAWEFDPDYVMNFTSTTFPVPGGAINHFNTMTYAGNGVAYGAGNVPALASNPPDYVNDKTYYIARIDLRAKTTSILPLLPSNGYAGFVFYEGGRLYAAMSTSRGSGIFRYDPATGVADSTPYITTQGYVNKIVKLED